ncbi:MAG TPA: heparan-alpha-glucosaminide N-acetyltransferase domain-containing protein [Jiangellaceae bacterium]|nr:heparan-alpha-glucosaminide N-acetyltransferase domain-containing protein [Jiangellaceae bacterium]
MATPQTLENTAVPAKKQRLVGVDATRGLALLGMMAVHALWAFDDEGHVTWTYELAAGRSAATFAVLAGIGIAFMTGRRQVTGTDRRAVAVRALIIGMIGLALGYADSDPSPSR